MIRKSNVQKFCSKESFVLTKHKEIRSLLISPATLFFERIQIRLNGRLYIYNVTKGDTICI